MKRCIALLSICLLLFTGCGGGGIGKIVLTTGFRSDEVFRIEDTSCALSEILVYLLDIRASYDGRYGEGIWETETADGTLEDGIKNAALSRISQVKTMNLLARDMQITLSGEERDLCVQAAERYDTALSDEMRASLNGVTRETLIRMYEEYALADKLYRYIIRDINPEISDDEARTITVQQIFVRKDTRTNAIGGDVARAIAMNAYAEARAGEDFKTLIDRYSDAPESTVSFGKGEREEHFETIAFNLETDEISSVIETEEGYYILKCLTTFNREETDANKLKIVAARKREVFAEEYDTFAASLAKDLNESLWEDVHVPSERQDTENAFFAIYASTFPPASEQAH